MSPEGAPSPPEAFRDLLAASAPQFGVSLPPERFDALSRFLAELDRWRRVMDLTGPLTAPELADHALESALGANLLPPGASVLDIGSGAGFPGVPLAITRPDSPITALEPRAKRAEFLRHIARTVPVRNLKVIQRRLEELEPRSFDVATSRAVGGLAKLADDGPFLQAGGLFLVWTTEPQKPAQTLSNAYLLEKVVRIPRTQKRVIACYRRTLEPM